MLSLHANLVSKSTSGLIFWDLVVLKVFWDLHMNTDETEIETRQTAIKLKICVG